MGNTPRRKRTMTEIYECHGKEGINYYSIVRDGKKFRLKSIAYKADGKIVSRGFLSGPTSKKKIIETMTLIYQTVTKFEVE